jgi:NADH:ubiquinone oxidoreductase subunit K
VEGMMVCLQILSIEIIHSTVSLMFVRVGAYWDDV